MRRWESVRGCIEDRHCMCVALYFGALTSAFIELYTFTAVRVLNHTRVSRNRKDRPVRRIQLLGEESHATRVNSDARADVVKAGTEHTKSRK